MEKQTWSFGVFEPKSWEDEISHQFYHSSSTGQTLVSQQTSYMFEVFSNFIESVRPARILEIGTAGGGTIQFLRDELDKNGLKDSTIKSFEISEHEWFPKMRESGIEVIVENIFDVFYGELTKPEMIVPYIQEEGITVVLCDGGNKITEFNIIAPHLKEGDIIMAHDYIDTNKNYLENYRDKIWNWREIGEEHVEHVSRKYNLQPFMQDEFSKAVWVCKLKNSS
jgi:predicted O-methyltransferase YrrM